MEKIEDLDGPSDFKRFLHDNFVAMMKELVDAETQIISSYQSNPSLPFDYYNLMLRDINAKIACKKEIYLRLTGERLE